MGVTYSRQQHQPVRIERHKRRVNQPLGNARRGTLSLEVNQSFTAEDRSQPATRYNHGVRDTQSSLGNGEGNAGSCVCWYVWHKLWVVGGTPDQTGGHERRLWGGIFTNIDADRPAAAASPCFLV